MLPMLLSIQQLPPAEEKAVMFALPSLPCLRVQTAWIVISPLINFQKANFKKPSHSKSQVWNDVAGDYDLDVGKHVAVACDGAAAMMGRRNSLRS